LLLPELSGQSSEFVRIKMVTNKTMRVLFLCTGNSCRSQLAEAIVNARFNTNWKAFSAGIKPTGFVHPLAIKVLQEVGITHQGRSKNVSEFKEVDFDLVVTVCDSANEECPVWLGKGKRIHRAFRDPALAGDIEAFRSVRDEILIEIPKILDNYMEELK
jgi:arsenate reductase (thioredoxin)